jgi:hypothetical protein
VSDASIGPITAAIRQAARGDRIRLKPGRYAETILVDRAVTLFAEAPGHTIIRPPKGQSGLVVSADATLSGISVDARGSLVPAVEVVGGSPALECLELSNAGCGVLVRDAAASPRLHGCRIVDCQIGVKVEAAGQALLKDCRFENTGLFPIFLVGRSRARVESSKFLRSQRACVSLSEGSEAEFIGCEWMDGPTDEAAEVKVQLLVVDGAIARLSGGCLIGGGKGIGIVVNGGRLEMADSELAENALAGLVVGLAGQADLVRCQVVRNGDDGVVVMEGGTLRAVSCALLGNTGAGLRIIGPTAAEILACRIAENMLGAALEGGGRGRFDRCDLSGNLEGPFDVEDGCTLECFGVRTESDP